MKIKKKKKNMACHWRGQKLCTNVLQWYSWRIRCLSNDSKIKFVWYNLLYFFFFFSISLISLYLLHCCIFLLNHNNQAWSKIHRGDCWTRFAYIESLWRPECCPHPTGTNSHVDEKAMKFYSTLYMAVSICAETNFVFLFSSPMVI